MSDTLFSRSLTTLTIGVVLFLIGSLVFSWLGAFWAVLSGVLIELAGGGALVYFWGKSYMGRA